MARNMATLPYFTSFSLNFELDGESPILIPNTFQTVIPILRGFLCLNPKVTFPAKFVPHSNGYIAAYQVGQVIY